MIVGEGINKRLEIEQLDMGPSGLEGLDVECSICRAVSSGYRRHRVHFAWRYSNQQLVALRLVY